MKRWSTAKKVAAGVVALVLIAAAGITAWFLTRPKAPTAQQQTTTAIISKQTMRQTVSASGTLAPQNQAYLNFPAAGTVTNVRVQVGDSVQSGQVLATQDTTTLDAAVTSATAAVNSASSSLTTLQDSSSATSDQIAAARAQLESARAQLATAQQNQSGATMTAPMSGVVAQVNLTPNTRVTGSTSVTTNAGTITTVSSATQAAAQIVVVDTTSWIVNATVAMADLPSLKHGMATTITPTGATTPLPGTLRSIGVVGSASGGQSTFPIVVAVTGNPPNLYIGGTADLTITVNEVQALVVPTAAISNTNGQTTVKVVKAGAQTETPITVGRTYGQLTEVTKGLTEGDEVVVPTGTRTGQGGAGRTPGAYGSGGNRGGGAAPSAGATTR